MSKNKFFLAIVFPVIVSIFISTTALAGFTDVPTSHPNYDAIIYVELEGIVQGYDDGTYKPDQRINRAEFTKIVIETKFDETAIEGCIESVSQPDWTFVFFPDVPITEWFAKYVCLAKNNAIVDGYLDGTYQPANFINFSEASKIITNTLIANTELGVDVWFKPFVEALESKNAIPTTIVDFGDEITRGEMAEIIYRIDANITDKESLTYAELAGEEPPEEEPVSEVKEFDMTARQFEFDPETITVNLGDTVILNITSVDVTHGFSLSAFGVNEQLVSGETVTVEFVADKAGTYTFACSVVCGTGHGTMKGTLVVEE